MENRYEPYEKVLRDTSRYLYRELKKEFPAKKAKKVVAKTLRLLAEEIEKER
jgi:hypothetical protein